VITMPTRADAVLADVLERHASERPHQPFALFEDGRALTYGELATRTWTIAHALRQGVGIVEGEIVAAWLPNGEEALLAWFAANAAGCVFAPLNTAYRGSLLAHALNVTKARVLVVHAELVGRLEGLALPWLETIVVVGDDVADLGLPFVRLGWETVSAEVVDARPHLVRPVEPWDDMTILMTSGTTGASKAVRRTYVHYDLYTEVNFRAIGATVDDRFFVCAPMFHGGADTPIFSMLQIGGSVAISSGFSASRFWPATREMQCTIAWIHSSMSLFLSKQPPRDDDRDNPLRWVMLAPLIEGFDAFAERFDVRIYMVYGMTEIPCVFRVVDPVTRRSLGTPVDPGYTARIVDENDLAIEQADVAGELVLRHELPWAISPGYLGDPDATARVWRNGWFHTGDVFARDARGDFYLVDRVKDSIRRRGENISAAEVETEILSHPDITEAAAIAVPAEMDEEILAYAVARPGSALDEERLHAYLVERLPYFAVPRYVVLADALPRNPALRVDKPQLRERGVPAGAWDREAAGIALQRERF
jgi:crotonobetaine/carnitine-CoA ligase